ncbi:MAG TPA: hypothetical protein VJB57_02790 [Dehalococcoidia bacterium]|nr:hypothetical protein [Dehalococcoidia bacterium]
MSFAALILKNLFRQRVRTSLTVVGISIGIAAIVAIWSGRGEIRATRALARLDPPSQF